MSASLEGKSVIVTGGSKGIGKGMARVFASHRAKVLIVARHSKDAEVPYLKQGSQGRVIITSSITGPITGYRGWTHARQHHDGRVAGMGDEYLKTIAASIPLKGRWAPPNVRTTTHHRCLAQH